MLYYEGSRLNGLWSPFGIETNVNNDAQTPEDKWLNGLWSPFGIETPNGQCPSTYNGLAKWPVEPVRD